MKGWILVSFFFFTVDIESEVYWGLEGGVVTDRIPPAIAFTHFESGFLMISDEFSHCCFGSGMEKLWT